MNINFANNTTFNGYLNKNVIPSLKKEYNVKVAEQVKNGMEKSLAEAKNKVAYEKFFAKLKETAESCHQETEFYVDTEPDANPAYYVNRIFARNRLAPYARVELHSYYFDSYGRPMSNVGLHLAQYLHKILSLDDNFLQFLLIWQRTFHTQPYF